MSHLLFILVIRIGGFAGASAGNYTSYRVSNGARVGIRDIWNDAASGASLVANVTGTSAFTYAGSALYLPSGSPVAISLNNFQGTAALVNMSINGAIKIIGDGSNARVLCIGLAGPSAQFFANSSSPPTTVQFLNGQTTANPPSGAATSQLPEEGTVDASFLTATLERARTQQPALLAPLLSGVTDLRFYRVFVDSAVIGIHLKAASAAPQPPAQPQPIAIAAGRMGASSTEAPTP